LGRAEYIELERSAVQEGLQLTNRGGSLVEQEQSDCELARKDSVSGKASPSVLLYYGLDPSDYKIYDITIY
jgi:hypothetical protein